MQVVGTIRLRKNWDKLLFLFIIIDILFLPYFPLMSVSFSVPLVILWGTSHIRTLFKGKEANIILLIILLMLISTLINPLFSGKTVLQTSFSTAVKRYFQYAISLCFLLCCKEAFYLYEIKLDEILFAFVIYVCIFAILYFVFPYHYASVKHVVSRVDLHTYRFLLGNVTYRFNYLWADPNNIAYAIVGVESFLLMKGNLGITKQYTLIGCTAFIVLASSSAGGMISFVLVNLLVIANKMITNPSYYFNYKPISIYMFFLSILIVVLLITQTDIFSKVLGNLLIKFQDRMTTYRAGSDISGGRWEDFLGAISMLTPWMLFLGGGQEGFTTEIGHIYLIGMYGFLVYVGFIILLFGKFKNQKICDYIWILPFFIGFTMNIGIGEYKWLAIFIVLLSFCRYAKCRNHI